MAYRLAPVRMGVATGRPAGLRRLRLLAGAERPAVGGALGRTDGGRWGAWGTLYHAEANRLLGFVQYGPSGRFPRASELPAGPPSPDAVLVTCAYLVDASSPWVLQSLFLAAIGGPATVASRPSRRSATAPDGRRATASARPQNDLPADFLADFGFVAVRWEDACLARLDLGGLQPSRRARPRACGEGEGPSAGAGAPAAVTGSACSAAASRRAL